MSVNKVSNLFMEQLDTTVIRALVDKKEAEGTLFIFHSALFVSKKFSVYSEVNFFWQVCIQFWGVWMQNLFEVVSFDCLWRKKTILCSFR